MHSRTISLPTLAMIAGTRGMLGAGIGLLAAGRLSDAKRRNVGRTLLAIGALSTIPLMRRVFRRKGQLDEHEAGASQAGELGGASGHVHDFGQHVEELRQGRREWRGDEVM